MAVPFSIRLKRARDKAGMTTSDLHAWFDRPYSTVFMWIARGYTPRGPSGKLAQQRLTLLEDVVKRANGALLVPANTPENARKLVVKQVFHDAAARRAKVSTESAT